MSLIGASSGLLLTAWVANSACEPPDTLIVGGQALIDARWVMADLRLRDERIVEIASKLSPEPQEHVIDAGGLRIVPGLIDAHAHLIEFGGPFPQSWGEAPSPTAMKFNVSNLLHSGVTSARIHLSDLHQGPALKRASRDSCTAIPRLALGGPGLFGGRPTMRGMQVRGVADSNEAELVMTTYAEAGR